MLNYTHKYSLLIPNYLAYLFSSLFFSKLVLFYFTGSQKIHIRKVFYIRRPAVLYTYTKDSYFPVCLYRSLCHADTHTPVSFAEPNFRRNWSHLSTGWIPTAHQRMQKIGEHLDSRDDTSICAAPVTDALQFLPRGGVRSAGHLPSSLAEAWSTRDRALEAKVWHVSPSPCPLTRTLARPLQSSSPFL